MNSTIKYIIFNIAIIATLLFCDVYQIPYIPYFIYTFAWIAVFAIVITLASLAYLGKQGLISKMTPKERTDLKDSHSWLLTLIVSGPVVLVLFATNAIATSIALLIAILLRLIFITPLSKEIS